MTLKAQRRVERYEQRLSILKFKVKLNKLHNHNLKRLFKIEYDEYKKYLLENNITGNIDIKLDE
jgi:SMC interacting uncharacterized protein involved in chromosome segregation